MSSVAERKRRKRTRLQIERTKIQPSQETRSLIQQIAARLETVTALEDKPYAEKRRKLGQAAIDWLFDRGQIDDIQRSAAWGFHADWRKAQLSPKTTAGYEPPMPRGNDEEPIDQAEAYSRYRWVQIRLSPEVWPVIEAVVLHCKPIADWIGDKRVGLIKLKADRAALAAELMELTDSRRGDVRETSLKIGEDIRKIDHKATQILGGLMDRRTASNLLHRGLTELATLRGEYHRKYG